ncbi:MAG TPA: arylsulfotransferase family protein [Stellaceae bacterium]|nr:arylsulfotransferase family protein [Stellaceae bacterium]
MNKWFPATTFHNALKTASAIVAQYAVGPFDPDQFIGFTGGPVADVERNRIVVRGASPAAAPDEHFLLSGGVHQFLDYCPSHGCLAVEFDRHGGLVHAYPIRPDQFDRQPLAALPYEEVGFRFDVNMYPWGLIKLPGGDLIATFHQWNAFPYGGGIARVRPDGSLAWFRHDYSNHWPTPLKAGEIAVPATRVGLSRFSTPLGSGVDLSLDCDGKISEDIVRILDPDGTVRQEISVFDAFMQSPYRGLLANAPAPCDPLHLNYVAPVTPGIVSALPDVTADDLIVSLRNVNAFAILGRHDGKLKHLFTGTFVHQHSVQPLGQSATMLIFDDLGADWNAGPSRLLAYDLAGRAERTLLPNPVASEHRMFSDFAGNISVSPDRSRAIVAFSNAGSAYEIGIADGKVFTVFNDVHDLRKVSAAGGERNRTAGRFNLYTAIYVH